MPKDRLVMLVTCAVCSLAGGFAANLVFRPSPAQAQDKGSTITAKQVEIVDGNGAVTAVLGPLGLELRDSTGGAKASLSITPSTINVKDARGQARITLGVFHGNIPPGMTIFDETGKPRFSVK